MLLLLVVAAPARPDTIVLKNGRRIFGSNVVEENGRVSYEVSTGRLSLPRSIVDHIEYGPVPPGNSDESSSLPIAPPALEASAASDEILRGAIHDGQIDRTYIVGLERAARAGESGAADRAAIGHHAAAQFELSHGAVDRALAEERAALGFAPGQPDLLMNVAYLHLRRGEYRDALENVELARRTAPDSAEASKLAGWAWYGMNDLDHAIAEWQRSLATHPDAGVQAALEKALRDRSVEEDFKENESSHFTLRYQGGAQPVLAREVLRTLELHFSAIESELRFTPREPIGVVLYTRETFADITRTPNWVGALNDGRIRVPVQGLTAVSPELSRVLKHELTHSFLAQKTTGHCPVWLQEGLAQWIEGKRSGENAAALVQVYDAGHAAPLVSLEGSWMRFPSDTAAYVYPWALANVEYIVQSGGMGDITRMLERIGEGDSTEVALREVLRLDYADLAQSTVEYLRRSYLR